MNKTDIKQYKEKLLQMKAELEAMEADLQQSKSTVILDQSSVGRLSRMDAMQGQQMALETDRRRASKLLTINAALRRIESDEFGYCAICDNEIAAGRLQINPAVTRCINCAE